MTYIPPISNGVKTPATASPIVLAGQSVSNSITAPALNYEFLTGTTNGWFDALGYGWMSVSFYISATITTGIVTFEATNDPVSAPAGIAVPAQLTSATSVSRVTTASLVAAAGTMRTYDLALPARYIRLRVSTAVAPGTGVAQVTASFKHGSPVYIAQYSSIATSLPAGTNNIGNLALLSSTNVIGSAALLSQNVTDGLVTITTNQTISSSGAVNLASISLRVSSVSGTSPKLDFVVQETWDGSTYVDLYHFERITASGTYASPTLRINGTNLRYSTTVSGTSPSFGTTISKNIRPTAGVNYRSYYDRTINLNTANSTTNSYYVQGTNLIHVCIVTPSGASDASVLIQGSMDGSNWATISSSLSTNTSAGVPVATSVAAAVKWVRVFVQTAGLSITLSYLHIAASGL